MKKLYLILPLAMILCFVVGCQDKEAMEELEEMKAQAALEEQNKEIVKRYFELMADRNPAYMELSSEDYLVHFPGGVDFKGRENLMKFQDSFLLPSQTYHTSSMISLPKETRLLCVMEIREHIKEYSMEYSQQALRLREQQLESFY